ncbi:lysophospholipid acyltransferase family protein [Estrella lausannensis]|uniref:DUF374 domain-containing protein n=1 Tax=Estrella lausannensis TaxID=483423 RepID=A0A0H5DNI1_9BACT|nr:lysophospholipid acyltransferase family protein [Estrella lausannensis]CRX37891.1 Conserved hypothetical protein [Estrella lausannensis]
MKRLYYYTIQKIIPRILGRIIKAAAALLTMTCRFELKGFDRFIKEAKGRPAILALWHSKLSLAPALLTRHTPFNYAALISKSKDGEIIAEVINAYGIRGEAIRVAHSAKFGGLIGAIDRVRKGERVLVITPDGPRGPARQVKGGIVAMALKSGALIFPMGWTCDTCWTLKTWDQMGIPKPFSKITVSIGAPINPDELTDHEMAATLIKERIDLQETSSIPE